MKDAEQKWNDLVAQVDADAKRASEGEEFSRKFA